ncbi:MAG TPA: hypothetical protein VFB00_05090 [Terriglobales bacterium]|nr:hypothetical protein [Terriglobales bacterium]
MQLAITLMAVVGGLLFSLAVALVAEELIFGQIFRIFFTARQKPVRSPFVYWRTEPVRVRAGQQRY